MKDYTKSMENFIAVDIETTGLNPEQDHIIEVGAVKFCKGEAVETFSSLVFTTKKINSFITQLTGITEQMIRNAPSTEQVKNELACFCEDKPLVFHNAPFDLAFLEKFYGKPVLNQYLDTLEITRIFFPSLSAYDLKSLADYFNLPSPSHRALDDAITCGYLLIKNLELIDGLKPQLLSVLVNFLQQPSNLLGTIIQQQYYQRTWSSKIESKEPIFHGLIYKTKAQEEKPTATFTYLDEFTIQNLDTLLCSSDSPILNKYPNFEFRSGQLEMLKEVCASFLDNRLFIAEAATGTGKSLAYLIPAVLWSVLRKEKVVISTHTINLQEQLSKKELPKIKTILGLENLVSTVIKGRSNYLCLNKLEQHFSNSAQNTLQQNYFLARITNWLANTSSGDKNELNLKQHEHEYWANVAADSYTCLGSKCNFYNACFVVQARRKAEQANILITNHSLLLSDVKLDNGILPPYKYLIIDEAHNLEQESINHLTIECSSYLLFALIKNLRQTLEHLAMLLTKTEKKNLEQTEIEKITNIKKLKIEALENLSGFQQAVNNFKISIEKLANIFDTANNNYSKWLKKDLTNKDEWLLVCSEAQNVIYRLQSLAQDFFKISNQIKHIPELTNNLDIHTWSQMCEEYAGNIMSLLNLEDEEKVVWLETYQDNAFSLKQAPLEVGYLLCEKIYQDKNSIIFTSATLTIEKDFSFFKKQVGLDLIAENRIKTAVYESPFDYEKQALLCIPTDLPGPLDATYRNDLELNMAIGELIIANKGRTLVLFTSYQQLVNCYYSLKETLQNKNINLLAHHIDGNRTSIIEQFKKKKNSVILGTNSFWEGVDLPGDYLTLLVIVKLPFQAPGIPTLAAKMEYLRNNNQDPFRNLNLPQAVIRFKQGFGRLVRSKQDSGIVVVLDKRIIEKSYGKKFLNSLPVTTHFRGSFQEIIKMILNRNQVPIDSVI